MQRSPLHALHQKLGARLVEFSGWEMPVQYEGVIAEHRAVREAVGVFDVSHLGRFHVSGAGATDVVRRLLCNDAGKLEPGRAQYTMMLNPEGGVEDDIIVWRWDEEDYWVLPNAGNHRKVLERFAAETGPEVEPLRERTAFLAVQGPRAAGALEAVVGWRPGRFRVGTGDFGEREVQVAGTGYTGEGGGEVAVDRDRAVALFSAFLEAGAVPCGLGARDTLRLEMGYPLWGQDLDPETTPLEGGLGWVVDWDHDFVGREALEEQRRRGTSKLLVGVVMEGREIPRPGYRLRGGGAEGRITSGNYSPMLARGIGLGFLAPPPSPALEELDVEVRGRWAPGRRVRPPFVGD